MSSMYCWSLFGGRYIAAIMIGLLLLMCILVAVISSCVGVVIGSWMMSDLMIMIMICFDLEAYWAYMSIYTFQIRA